MKTFIVVVMNQRCEILMFKTESIDKYLLYNADRTVSKSLSDKMLKDTYLFGGYNREQIANCKVLIAEELKNEIATI